LNQIGERLEQRWNARLFSTYGITELAASLGECEAGCGGHLHPELLHVEILDEQGQPVPDGEVGEVTATTFGVEAMPLVRYRTGDYAALFREPCRCGRATPRLGPIVGRKHHKLKLKGTTLFPSTLKRVLDSVAGVSAYAILARRENGTSDAVEIRLVCEGETRRVLGELRERFQGEAKVAPVLTVSTPEEVEALQMPAGARKRRVFVDLRG
jgi:phenylacetate-CoA ligase